MIIAGLDISSHTGLVISNLLGDGSLGAIPIAVEFHFKADKEDRFGRYFKYVDEAVSKIKKQSVELVIIEGYSFAEKFNNYFQYELGALIKGTLRKHNIDMIEVPPTSLKKYVTGKGNIKKNLILLEVYKRWGFDTKSDNIADAYGLMQFGRGFCGFDVALPKSHTEALKKVLESHPKMAAKYGTT